MGNRFPITVGAFLLLMFVALIILPLVALAAPVVKQVQPVEQTKEQKQLVEITKAMDLIMREPGSGQYKLGEMIKGECHEQVDGVFYKAIDWRGDAMNFLANGKNAYGGYTGFQPYTALFDSIGKVVMILDGADFGRYGFPLGFPTVNEAGLCTKF